MSNCPTCGLGNEGDARYCDNCGSSFQGGRPPTAIELGRLALLIGANPDSDVVVDHPQVSGYHLVAWLEGNQVCICDLGSTNGTFMNGHQVTRPEKLEMEATLQLGSYAFNLAGIREKFLGASRAYLVGRDQAADLYLDAAMVSACHVLIKPAGGTIKVIDLYSSNGTFLNERDNRVVGASEASRDDVLFLGSYRLPLERTLGEFSPEKREEAKAATVKLQDKPLILGRDDTCDIVLPYPQVSARHAKLTPQAEGNCLVEDLGSTNGIFVNGIRTKKTLLYPGSTLSLGSIPVELEPSGVIRAIKVKGTMRLDAIQVSRVVTHRKTKKPLKILDDVSVSVYPNELVGLMGPSGAGKSTALKAMNGYESPTRGKVRVNNESLYGNYDRFRGLIGYLPQDDIIHKELTVEESLYYTARLRMTSDHTDREIKERIKKLLEQLDLYDKRGDIIGSVEQQVLSGGQRKRVNLAQELVTDPVILFLDEPTSGLSSRDTREVMKLLRDLADHGHTIIVTIHQPSQEVYEMMDHIMLLTKGGKLAFYGPTTPDSYDYFKASQDPDQVMDNLEKKPPDTWQKQYLGSDQCETYIQERLSKAKDPDSEQLKPPRQKKFASPFRQWWTLFRRYTKIKFRDKTNLIIMLLQAPVVGILLALMFHDAQESPMKRAAPIFFMCVAAIFFGCFNACREIVSERSIYKRERMVNLKVIPYVLSKFAFLGLVGLFQVLLLYVIGRIFMGLSGNWLAYLGLMSVTILASTAMGLLLSAVVRSSEAAMAIVPIILIPQIILSGFMVPLSAPKKEYVAYLAFPMLSRWSVEGLMEIERKGLAKSGTKRPPKFAFGRKRIVFKKKIGYAWIWKKRWLKKKHLTPRRLGIDFLVITAFLLLFLFSCFLLVKRQDRQR